jgi:catechol 2,3-dioxygenase-like lactoylglutathione lyase family enzyme
MFKKIHHVGLVTDDMERTKQLFLEKPGYEPNRIQVADTGWAHATFLRMGDVEIEIMQPYDPKNHYTAMLKKNGGPCLSHIALSKPDTGEAGKNFEGKGTKFLEGFWPGTYTPRGYEIIFLDPSETEGIVVQMASDVPAKDMGY